MKLFKAIFTLSALLAVVGVQARQMYIGNLNFEDKFRQSGVAQKDTIGAAVFVSAEDLKSMVGAELIEVSFYKHENAKVAYLKVFVSKNLDSVPLFEKELDVANLVSGWNHIALDEALVLDGDSLYLGYQLLSQATISQAVTNSSQVQSFIKNGSSGKWTATKGIAVYATVVGDNLPAHDIILSSELDFIDVEINEPVDFVLVVENVAADTIRTIEFECDYGNGKKDTTIIEVEIPYLAVDSVVYADLLFDSIGKYTVKFTALQLNGEEDLTPEDNVCVLNVNAVERIVERKILLEVFSTENCTNCPKGHEKIEKAVAGRHDKVIEVGHHVGFYTDQWTVPADTIYMNFYYAAIVTTFAPAGMLDRTLFTKAEGHHNSYQGGDSCVVFSLESNNTKLDNLIDVQLAKPAYAWIDLSVDFNEVDSMLTITTSGKSVMELAGDPRLTIYVTEDNLASERQAGWNSGLKGPYYQHNVNRYIATDVWGDQVALNEGFEKEYKVKVQSNWNVDNLNVVAFVHNYSTKPNVKERYTDFNVYNAEKVQVRAHEVAVDDVETSPVSIIARQDDVLEIVGEYESGVIYNVNGQVVATLRGSPTASIANIPNGVYVVSLTLADGTRYNTKIVK